MSISEAIYKVKVTLEVQATRRIHSRGMIQGKVMPMPRVSGIMKSADQLMHENLFSLFPQDIFPVVYI